MRASVKDFLHYFPLWVWARIQCSYWKWRWKRVAVKKARLLVELQALEISRKNRENRNHG